MNRYACKALSLLLLVGCSGGPVSIQPGQWETTTALTTIEYGGVAVNGPSGEAMRAPETKSECISAAEAADPVRNMVQAGDGDRCRFTESVFADGIIRQHGICREEGGATSTMSLEGTYEATAMSMRMTVERTSGTLAEENSRLTGTMTSRRTGECAPAAAH